MQTTGLFAAVRACEDDWENLNCQNLKFVWNYNLTEKVSADLNYNMLNESKFGPFLALVYYDGPEQFFFDLTTLT